MKLPVPNLSCSDASSEIVLSGQLLVGFSHFISKVSSVWVICFIINVGLCMIEYSVVLPNL